ncbi:MAG TPA: ArsR family transcriptional regulator [Longimicrobiales bacterium]|nr:ArsR family transcriptional regulator [Longimicrobiales bacterium]
MAMKRWRQRILASTRGRVLALLRRGPRTVAELAEELRLTPNAVRAHLSALERDGLVEQQGVRRGIGKPAHIYELSAEAESFFPGAYSPVLAGTFGLLRERLGAEGLEEFVRTVGHRAGAGARNGRRDLREKAGVAVEVLNELGAAAELREEGGQLEIRGRGCPLADVVRQYPQTCALAEGLIEEIVGVPVAEHCDRGDRPNCSFLVGAGAGAKAGAG